MDTFSRILGERLRAARRSRGWSLLEVEEASGGEFKASVLGAYERGERAMSVSRMWRLAELYDIRPSTLLPEMAELHEPVVLDLSAAEEMTSEQASVIDRFLTAIQRMRRDVMGNVLAVRQADLRVLSALLEAEVAGSGMQAEDEPELAPDVDEA